MKNHGVNWRWTGWVAACGLAILAAGCRRDPLDLEVRAATADEFLEWQERVMARQAEGVATEFKEAVARIVAASPTKVSLHNERLMHNPNHPICRQLNGRTVRDVIIAGYRAANEMLLRAMILDSDNVVAAVKYEAVVELAASDRARLERSIARRSEVLGAARAQVEANRRRIAELENGARREDLGFLVRFSWWRVLTFILL